MTKMIMRGIQDIRTRSGNADAGALPYKSYMKLTILEMEKFRRGKERQSALERVQHIDQRFKDIEVERQEIMSALDVKGAARRDASGKTAVSEMTPRTTTGPFKIKY